MKNHGWVIIGILSLMGCAQEAAFSGGKPKASVEAAQNKLGDDQKKETNPTGVGEPKKCDFTKDFVEVSFSKKIEDCNKAGNIWDFSRSVCSTVPKATSFECSFPGFLAAMDKLGTPDERVQENQAKGAKLVACGEKEGIVLAQWYIPTTEQKAENDCSASNASFVTACYSNTTLASGSETTMVSDCLK
jgi:hypothetical protein